ncbi:unnamed protein product [Lactuca virosa]|uniref:CRIB domain-containing protein n=1 Tax=Lactuca virosa TaxID=75947 RepID=A0AAU9P8V8_9ASTR|nr:unnamed protein product [Lactuca virosa]
MKNRMERLVVLPFTAGCVSSSSVSVSVQHGRRPKEDINSAHMVCRSREVPKNSKDTSSDHMMKGSSSSRFPTPSIPNIYIGFHRLTRTIKNLSQSLVFKEEMEELEMEMDIGLPTDVKHVTHIGFDGSMNPGANGCNHLDISDFLSLCPNSMAQYEQRAMFVPVDATHDSQNTSYLPSLSSIHNLHRTPPPSLPRLPSSVGAATASNHHFLLRSLQYRAPKFEALVFPIEASIRDDILLYLLFRFSTPFSTPLQYQSIVDAEWNIIYDKLDKCVKTGAKIVLSRLAIGDLATQYFCRQRYLMCWNRRNNN